MRLTVRRILFPLFMTLSRDSMVLSNNFRPNFCKGGMK